MSALIRWPSKWRASASRNVFASAGPAMRRSLGNSGKTKDREHCRPIVGSNIGRQLLSIEGEGRLSNGTVAAARCDTALGVQTTTHLSAASEMWRNWVYAGHRPRCRGHRAYGDCCSDGHSGSK